MIKYLYLFTFVGFGILFSGCVVKVNGVPVPSGFEYTITSNVSDTKVYCGTSKENLELCYTTPYLKRLKYADKWNDMFFQGRKVGYLNSEILQLENPLKDSSRKIHFNMKEDSIYKAMRIAFEKVKIENSVLVYEQFIKLYADTEEAEIVLILLDNKRALDEKNKYFLDNFLSYLNKKDIRGLFDYIHSSSDIMAYAKTQSKINLLLSGPDELQVGMILQYHIDGLSEDVLSSKIKNLNKPYRKFSLAEMKRLMDLGLSDTLLISMLDVTTAYEKEDRQMQMQKDFLKAQENKKQTIIYQDLKPVKEKSIGDLVLQKVVKSVIKSLDKGIKKAIH